MPQPAQVQGKAQPEQPAVTGPRGIEWARGRARQSGREHTLGPGLERRDAAQARGAAVGRRKEPAAPLDRAGGQKLTQCRGGSRSFAEQRSLGVRAGGKPATSLFERSSPRPHAGRSLHPEGARRSRAGPRSRRRSRHLDPPRQLRPDGPAAAARRDRGFRRRSRS